MDQRTRTWVLVAAVWTSAVSWVGCCEEQETAPTPEGSAAPGADGAKGAAAAPKAEEKGALAAESPEVPKGTPADKAKPFQLGGEGIEGVEKSQEPAVDEEGNPALVDEEAPDMIERKGTRHEAIGQTLGVSEEEDWEYDFTDLGGAELVVAISEEGKGDGPTFKAAMVKGDKVLDQSEDFKAFTGADDKTMAAFKDCQSWSGGRIERLTIGEQPGAKVSYWCTRGGEQFSSVELVSIYRVGEGAESIADLKLAWTGLGGSTGPLDEKCSQTTEALFAADEKTLKRTLKVVASPMGPRPNEEGAVVVEIPVPDEEGEEGGQKQDGEVCKAPKDKVEEFALK